MATKYYLTTRACGEDLLVAAKGTWHASQSSGTASTGAGGRMHGIGGQNPPPEPPEPEVPPPPITTTPPERCECESPSAPELGPTPEPIPIFQFIEQCDGDGTVPSGDLGTLGDDNWAL